jgi:cytosine/adenosine deaminase-related metal-dependent hydrolase
MVLTYFYGHCSRRTIFNKVCKGNYFKAYMIYRKLKATGLFTGHMILDESSVLIISAEGEVLDLLRTDEAGEGVETYQGILSPGLVNCHCHLELSHLKGLVPERTGLVDFVFTIITQRHFPEAEIYEAISRAEDDMLTNGIVATGDICNNLLTIPQKQRQRLSYYNFVEVSGWLPQLAEPRFQKSLSYYEDFGQLPMAGNHRSLSPHAPYSVSNELWDLIRPHFKKKTITIHNQETVWEDELFRYGTGDANRMYRMMKFENPSFRPSGKSSLQTYLPLMKESKIILLVHNTYTSREDVKWAKANTVGQQLFFCLCPNANLYIENNLPPIELFREQQCRLVLGTDSLASNYGLDILEEIKTIQRQYPRVPLEEMLQWATLNGAEALQLDGNLGSFDKGKKPGVVLIENTDGRRLTEASRVTRLI